MNLHSRDRRSNGGLAALPPVLHGAFLVVIMLAPLPLASNREWSWSLCALLVGVIGVLHVGAALAAVISSSRNSRSDYPASRAAEEIPHQVQDDGAPNRKPSRLKPLLQAGFLAVIAWALFQASSLAPAGWVHPLWGMTGEVLGGADLAGAISLAPDDSLAAAMRLLCYGLVFWLAYQWGRDEQLAQRTFLCLVLAGVVYAIYGLGKYWSGSETLFWFESTAYKNSVHGTFVNRNHFATYLGLVLICALALFYHRVAMRGGAPRHLPVGGVVPRGARVTTLSDRLEHFALQSWKSLLAILLLTTALVLTHSRGGFLSTVAGAAVLLLALNHRRRVSKRHSRAVIIAAAGVAAITFWMSSEVLLQRLDTKGVSDELRFSAYELITESSADNPLLGFGYGSFADSFRLYRTDEIGGYLDRAHNTYLENIFELGWPAALLLFALLIACLAVCVRGLRNRGRDWVYPAAGIAATTLAGIHAGFDFSLQMPAVAMTFAVIMGVACAQSASTRSP